MYLRVMVVRYSFGASRNIRSTGNIYYRRIDDEGNMTGAVPIAELENGIGRDFETLINVYNHNLQMIRDVTGINEARDASQPSSEALVGSKVSFISI